MIINNLGHSPQTLAGLNDLNDFCDLVDSLEEQGIEKIMDVSTERYSVIPTIGLCTRY